MNDQQQATYDAPATLAMRQPGPIGQAILDRRRLAATLTSEDASSPERQRFLAAMSHGKK